MKVWEEHFSWFIKSQVFRFIPRKKETSILTRGMRMFFFLLFLSFIFSSLILTSPTYLSAFCLSFFLISDFQEKTHFLPPLLLSIMSRWEKRDMSLIHLIHRLFPLPCMYFISSFFFLFPSFSSLILSFYHIHFLPPHESNSFHSKIILIRVYLIKDLKIDPKVLRHWKTGTIIYSFQNFLNFLEIVVDLSFVFFDK